MRRVRNVYTPDQVPQRKGLPLLVKATLGALMIWVTISIWTIALGGG